jgi:hypothetical protein
MILTSSDQTGRIFPEEMMNPENPKNSKLASVAVVGIGVTLYWTFTYSGPYRYLAELEIKWFGYYVPKLTALVIILGLLLIAGVIKLILRGAERPVPGPTATTVSKVKSAPVPLPCSNTPATSLH